ncbi:C-C motif chemokine 2-like [Acanthopagrus latus]|uniref:C-C motif chemokine 2-like n=1 Tax=Acanthopagrus latus TaxID=8177 RepID=UPI00187C5BA3|nr:C-C motif chemokine 2-like [Acanthopagrus latus]
MNNHNLINTSQIAIINVTQSESVTPYCSVVSTCREGFCSEIFHTATDGQSRGVNLKMRVSLVFATFLCFTTWTSSIQSHGSIISCCLMVSNTRIQREHIADYVVLTRPQCPIDAIVFRTIHDKRICSDPDSLWTKTTMVMLDGRRWQQSGPHSRENEQNDEGATSAVTPATATTSKLHHKEKPKVQWKNVLNIFCLRNHNTSPSYHSQQTSLFPVVLLLLYCISEQ